MRDIQAVPFRWTRAYKRAAEIAATQRAAMHHRVEELWPLGSGGSASLVLRRFAVALNRG